MTRLGNIERELKNAEPRGIKIAWTAVGSVAATLVFASLLNLINMGMGVQDWVTFWGTMQVRGNILMFLLGLVVAIIAWLGAKRGWKILG